MHHTICTKTCKHMQVWHYGILVWSNFAIQVSAYHLIEILVFGICKIQYTFALKHWVLWHYIYFSSMSKTPCPPIALVVWPPCIQTWGLLGSTLDAAEQQAPCSSGGLNSISAYYMKIANFGQNLKYQTVWWMTILYYRL